MRSAVNIGTSTDREDPMTVSETDIATMPTEIDIAKLLVDLVKNQDQVAQKWLEFLIAIEAGLAVALGFSIRPIPLASGVNPTELQQLFSNIQLSVLPLFGILFAAALTRIVVRERQWQSFYVARVTALPTLKDKIFPSEKGNPSLSVSKQNWGKISHIVVALGICISVAWIVVGVTIWRK